MSQKLNVIKNDSEFMQAALSLDEDLGILDAVTKEIESLNLGTEKGLKRSLQQLDYFNEVRDRISKKMSRLATSLHGIGSIIEASADIVQRRALEIQSRHDEADALFQKFKKLGDAVAQATTVVAEVAKEAHSSEALAEKTEAAYKLVDILEGLASEAMRLKEEAGRANLKILEQNAHNLRQKIQSATRRITESSLVQ